MSTRVIKYLCISTVLFFCNCVKATPITPYESQFDNYAVNTKSNNIGANEIELKFNTNNIYQADSVELYVHDIVFCGAHKSGEIIRLTAGEPIIINVGDYSRNHSYIELTYTMTQNGVKIVDNYTENFDMNGSDWKGGNSYDYTITPKLNSITFDPSVKNWS